MKIEVSTIDLVYIQHALGHYAGLEGYNRNVELTDAMKQTKARLRIAELKANEDANGKEEA